MVVLGLTSAAILFVLGWLLWGLIAPGLARRLWRPDLSLNSERNRLNSKSAGAAKVALRFFRWKEVLVHSLKRIGKTEEECCCNAFHKL